MSKGAAEEPVPAVHAFADSTFRFEMDSLLRKHGYRIWRRVHREEAIWERGGEEYRQRDALRTIPNEEIMEAKRREQRYYGQNWR